MIGRSLATYRAEREQSGPAGCAPTKRQCSGALKRETAPAGEAAAKGAWATRLAATVAIAIARRPTRSRSARACGALKQTRRTLRSASKMRGTECGLSPAPLFAGYHHKVGVPRCAWFPAAREQEKRSGTVPGSHPLCGSKLVEHRPMKRVDHSCSQVRRQAVVVAFIQRCNRAHHRR